MPAINICGQLNKWFAIANGRLSRQRIPYAAGCIGIAVTAHEMALEYSKQRQTLEYSKQRQTFCATLSNRQAIQWMLVDNEIDIKQATWLTLKAADRAHRGDSFRKEAPCARSLLQSRRAGWLIELFRSTEDTL
ncbi:MAG: acyl-CoA dehydrogenase family protein [Pseudomonadota bacterium]|nr:acyl-CoA dehydrogenase family protein [Pseudomonadota bacterium]